MLPRIVEDPLSPLNVDSLELVARLIEISRRRKGGCVWWVVFVLRLLCLVEVGGSGGFLLVADVPIRSEAGARIVRFLLQAGSGNWTS